MQENANEDLYLSVLFNLSNLALNVTLEGHEAMRADKLDERLMKWMKQPALNQSLPSTTVVAILIGHIEGHPACMFCGHVRVSICILADENCVVQTDSVMFVTIQNLLKCCISRKPYCMILFCMLFYLTYFCICLS